MCDAAVHVAKCLAIELFNKLSAIKFFFNKLAAIKPNFYGRIADLIIHFFLSKTQIHSITMKLASYLQTYIGSVLFLDLCGVRCQR
jgi:hypothetical protein